MRSLKYGLLLAGQLALGSSNAQTIEEARLTNAGAVLQAFTNGTVMIIPPEILSYAQGVAVIPGVLRMGLVFGGRRGRGVVTVRGDDGNWSNPAFITLTGGSVGAQIGVESTDIVLIFGSARSVRNIGRGKFTLGGDAAVTAGPVDRIARATTDMTLTSEVYAYSDSRGLFAGASLEGTRLSMDANANGSFYPPGSSAQPLQPQNFSTPAAVRRFLLTLEQSAGSSAPPRPSNGDEEEEEVIIYPLGGTDDAE
ncbi:MAG: lipid-binding SYLF domain-containing protein [Gammaproteobacteria bacterium]|nr:lipid-binding SYLF domain-containing protein [Gammaproteobacteria bacterium]